MKFGEEFDMMGSRTFQPMGMDSSDVVTYLKMMEYEDNGEIISRWGEDIAYGLYVDKQYEGLKGFVLYYIFEVVTGNMKMFHFNQLESKVGLKYFSPEEDIVSNFNNQEGAMLTRYVVLTESKDMRNYGEQHFEEFITYYIKELVISLTKESLGDRGMVNVFTMLDRVEYALQFIYYATREGMGVVTEERYLLIKERIFEYIQQEIEKSERERPKQHISRGNFIIKTMENLYKRAEMM